VKDLGFLIKQAQRLKTEIERIQEELSKKTVEATAGGGMVTVVANGRQQIISINIEKEVVNPNDISMLQDLILAAVNEALRRSQELAQEEMKKLTGGFQIPGLF